MSINYLPVFEGLFLYTSPVPLICEATVRLPLVELNDEEKKKLDAWAEMLN